jgi:primosomal replication protein N
MFLLIHLLDLTELLLQIPIFFVVSIIFLRFVNFLVLSLFLLLFCANLTSETGVKRIQLSDDARHHQVVAKCHREEISCQIEWIIKGANLGQNIDDVKSGSRILDVRRGFIKDVLEHNTGIVVCKGQVKLGLLGLKKL